ncbi:PAS domain-containing protein [uncultured Eudoraea sp.]|uniref:PAS domain-containing protein n=1 Tax=uncultured Eudoraea sp. TaxID=1035614 RepID=UPI0026125AEC|nr:PAS domain-containing protein [uncultured Eudoraea sp.]
MSAHEIEIILSRQLADCLSVPVFIVDPDGTLIFYNEPAEKILGQRFEDTGEMKVGDWGNDFHPHDKNGDPIPAEELPLVQTIYSHRPAHKTFWIKNFEGKAFEISVTSIPIVGRSKQFSGALAIFWDNNLKI